MIKTIKMMLVLCTLTCAAVSAQTTKLHITGTSEFKIPFSSKENKKIELDIKQNKSNDFILYVFDAKKMAHPLFTIPIVNKQNLLTSSVNNITKLELKFFEKDTKNIIFKIKNKKSEPIDAEISIKKA